MQTNIESFENEYKELRKNRVISKYLRASRADILKRGIVVYGGLDFGEFVVFTLTANGIKPRFIIDANPDLTGQLIFDTEIRLPTSLSDVGDSFVMLCSTNISQMIQTCEKYNVDTWITPSAIRDWCPLLGGDIGICMDNEEHFDELASAYELMSDEKSRDIFRAFVRWHHVFDNDFEPYFDKTAYFPKDLASMIDYSSFIDAGAFIGDTLADWISYMDGKGVSYYAFEPHPTSYSKLCEMVSELPEPLRQSVQTYNAALGNENSCVELVGLEAISYIQQSMSGIPCKRVDDLSLQPSIIKADIEGAEMDMLRGAEQTIRKESPALAISIYHRYADLREIPRWIHNLGCGYRIYLRHHRKRFTDTVCYAIPNMD